MKMQSPSPPAFPSQSKKTSPGDLTTVWAGKAMNDDPMTMPSAWRLQPACPESLFVHPVAFVSLPSLADALPPRSLAEPAPGAWRDSSTADIAAAPAEEGVHGAGVFEVRLFPGLFPLAADYLPVRVEGGDHDDDGRRDGRRVSGGVAEHRVGGQGPLETSTCFGWRCCWD